jgi:DNA polymerase-1
MVLFGPASRPDPLVVRSLLIIDGHAFAYRAFHAIPGLTSPGGEPTNAIFGFVKMLGRVRETVHPTHIAVVWDGGLDAKRCADLPGYKAQRPPMPDALRVQLDGMTEYLAAVQIGSILRNGVEADDIIATLAGKAAASGMRVVVASSDKDFMQLVSDTVGLLNPADKEAHPMTPEDVRRKTGVSPEQIVDWLSLIGDTVDNIPGVDGVGLKTATSLLVQFGSLDGIYTRIGEVLPERVRKRLHEAESLVRRNRDLIRLKSDISDLPVLETLAAKPSGNQRVESLFERWGFNRSRPVKQEADAVQGCLFA